MSRVIDFGCRLNIAEGAAIAHLIDGRDMTVINGCAVTGEAMRQTAQAARRSRHEHGGRVVVTGCAAQIDPARFAAMDEVDVVIGNREKLERASYDLADGVHVAPMPRLARHEPVVSGAGQTRAFVEIQTGCDHRCTFCIIPFGRGDSASIPASAIVAAIARAVDAGQSEIVLTGVDLTSYRPSLAVLVATILCEVPALTRLRLSSLDPAEVDDALFDLITSEPRIMPHVHLSLQSGDALTLKRMKRRHTPEQAIDLVERIHAARLEVAIGADLIAGFPTETEAMHANNVAVIDACRVVFAHVFPYSPRAGTPAARMPQVATTLARARAAEIRNAADQKRTSWLAGLIGTRQDVLVERSGRRGHAPNFATVALDGAHQPGSIISATITGSDATGLIGASLIGAVA